MTDGVTDDIVWIQVRGCPGSIKCWVLNNEKKKEAYILYIYYITYMLYILYISYMHIIYTYIAYIYTVKSEWYINRISFTTYIVKPT